MQKVTLVSNFPSFVSTLLFLKHIHPCDNNNIYRQQVLFKIYFYFKYLYLCISEFLVL